MRQNTTLLIIHSGNLEYVCIRHRASQTLYISDILHVPRLKDPGYGKLQVGVYITAVDDAMRRVVRDTSSELLIHPSDSALGVPLKLEGNITTVASSNKRARGSGRERPRKRGSGDSARGFAELESVDLEPDAAVSLWYNR